MARPIRANRVTVSATDSEANLASCSTVVTVVDLAPPEIIFSEARPKVLWPPNHQLVAVNVSALVEDNCAPTSWSIVRVESNETPTEHGNGSPEPDIVVTGDHTVRLRAERSSRGDGRIYSITIQAVDATGNPSKPVVVQVTVPKLQKNN